MTRLYYTIKEVAYSLDVSQATVRRYAIKLGIDKRNKHWLFRMNEIERIRDEIAKVRRLKSNARLPTTLNIDIEEVSLKGELILHSVGDTDELIERIIEWTLYNPGAFIRDVKIEKIVEKN